MTYVSEPGIPLPEDGRLRARFPFRRMAIHDSFFVPLTDYPGASVTAVSHRVGSAARQAAIKTGFKFSVRKVDGGVRCWRVE